MIKAKKSIEKIGARIAASRLLEDDELDPV
jgi:hypothetical protein